MNDTPDKPDTDFTKSEELRELFRVLSAVQANAIVRVMRGNDAEDMRQIAIKEIEELKALESKGPGARCGPGEVWDETLGRCV